MRLNIEGIEVEFPYNAYDCQVAFMQKVLEAFKKKQNAALESPTGTGKTLCLLCGALAYVKDVKSRLTIDINDAAQGISPGSLFPKIFFASRTHSQLSQVVRELNKTLYKDTKTVTLGSRDVLCINEKVIREGNSVTKAFMCRNLVQSRKCHYYNEFEKLDNSTMDFLYNEKGCVPDIEDVISISKMNRICPFYRTRSTYETAELILVPYNYIIDPRLRHTHGIQLKGNIIVFDEAHNLEAICEESVSVSLSSLEVSGSIRECKAVLEGLINDEEEIRLRKDECEEGFREESTQAKVFLEKNDVAHLLVMLQTFETVLDEFYKMDGAGRNLNRSDGKVYTGQKMVDLLIKAEFRREIRDEITLLIDRMGLYLIEKGIFNLLNAKASNSQRSGIWSVKSVYLQKFASFISTVYADNFDEIGTKDVHLLTDSIDLKRNQADNFQLFVEKSDSSLLFNYWCFTPSVAMRSLCIRSPRSIIVTSGTLSPLNAFITGMGINIPVQLQNAHVAGSNQILTACVRADPYNNVLCGSFNNRATDGYLVGVGNTVAHVCSFVPQGVIVFFSSYSLMHLCLKRWKMLDDRGFSLWNAICDVKKLFIEPKSKTELKLIMLQYKETVNEGNGAVLFAVCRAKVSEGIDFADHESRAVILIGIPYAPVTDPRIELKQQFLRMIKSKEDPMQLGHRTLNAEEWYQTDAVRAVNQAIGRVLRHKDDFGVVILADSRYCSLNRKLLPLWLQSSVKNYNKLSDFEPECVEFFKKHGLQIIKRKEQDYKELFQDRKVKKRKTSIDEKYNDISTDGNRMLLEIKDLYAADKLHDIVKNQREVTSKAKMKIAEDLRSKLDEIDMVNEENGFVEFETIKQKCDEDFELFMPIQPTVSKKKRIKLKPNSCKNNAVIQRIRQYLDAHRKTPQQFAELLRRKNRICHQKVKMALKDYSDSRNIISLIDNITTATLPNNSEIFLGVYGFLNDDHKDEFAATCHSLELIKL